MGSVLVAGSVHCLHETRDTRVELESDHQIFLRVHREAAAAQKLLYHRLRRCARRTHTDPVTQRPLQEEGAERVDHQSDNEPVRARVSPRRVDDGADEMGERKGARHHMSGGGRPNDHRW